MTIEESQMRKFDIDDALNCALVCTKNGEIVTQITVFDNVDSVFCIAGVLDGSIETWTKDGDYMEDWNYSVNALMLYEDEKSKQKWINIFTGSKTKEEFPDIHVFDSEEIARKYAEDLGAIKHRQVRIDNV